MIDLEAHFALAKDVVIQAASELSERDRARAGCHEDDFVISKLQGRASSKAITRNGLEFLNLFKSPLKIADAIRKLAVSRNSSPDAVLEAYFPVIMNLVNDCFIVTAAEIDQNVGSPSLLPGANVAGFKIRKCIQMLDDMELYMTRGSNGTQTALKLCRTDYSADVALLEREATLYKHLDGHVNPHFLASGRSDGRAYLVMEWIDGRPVTEAADTIRKNLGGVGAGILELCTDVLDAFAHLHDQGLVHGDVHPNNILVDVDGRVKVIDYGIAHLISGPEELTRARRGGMGFFFDPQYAAAKLQNAPTPVTDQKSEQYSLGSLIYLMITGQYYIDFSFDSRSAFQQIRDEPPRAFEAIGLASWPDLESLLAKALAKSPEMRFESVSSFCNQLKKLVDDLAKGIANQSEGPTPNTNCNSSSLSQLLADVINLVGGESSLTTRGLTSAPTCSVHSGASGIAYALYRIACQRGDSKLLAMADLWSARAMCHMCDDDAYFDSAHGVTEATVGRSSLVHSPTGTACIHTLVAQAAGDYNATQWGVDQFIATASLPCENPDLFLGRSGLLVGCALQLDAVLPIKDYIDGSKLRQLGDEISRTLWEELSEQPPIGIGSAYNTLGAAHGWSGMLYALMVWSQAVGQPPPRGLKKRLDQLADCALPTDFGVQWPVRIVSASESREHNYMQGWCNGGAGHAHTWLMAFTMYRDSRYLNLAVQSAAQSFNDSLPLSSAFLCCGMTGVGFALLAVYRATGESDWLDKAFRLAEAAATLICAPNLPMTSLFRGAMGLAILASALNDPESATMPIFGREI